MDMTFFVDEQAGLYGTFSRWDAREEAEMAGDALRAELQRALADIDLQGPPQIRTVEIYEPKGWAAHAAPSPARRAPIVREGQRGDHTRGR